MLLFFGENELIFSIFCCFMCFLAFLIKAVVEIWGFALDNFDSLKRKILTVWKGKFWQFGKENFDSLKRKILTVWKGKFDSLKRKIWQFPWRLIWSLLIPPTFAHIYKIIQNNNSFQQGIKKFFLMNKTSFYKLWVTFEMWVLGGIGGKLQGNLFFDKLEWSKNPPHPPGTSQNSQGMRDKCVWKRDELN